jgi:uncharacterized protein YaiI (UPF0178 family)
MFFDTSHVYEDGYSEVITVDKGPDQVDFALIEVTKPGDIVVTQDYGVACMALAKLATPISQNGLISSEDNMDSLLLSRYTSQKLRKANKRTKGPKKRDQAQNDYFKNQLAQLILKLEEK